MSLDALLRMHGQTVKSLTRELAKITQDLMQMEQHAQSLEARIRTEAEAYQQQTERGMQIEAVTEGHARLEAHHDAVRQAQQAIRALTGAWSHAQARLVEASQEHKVLERFAERQRQAHRSESDRREQLAMDEAGHRQPRAQRLS